MYILFEYFFTFNFCSFPDQEIDENTNQETNPTESTEDLCPKKIFHNVSYRLWSFDPKYEASGLLKTNNKQKQINVLVRCKLDGCEV